MRLTLLTCLLALAATAAQAQLDLSLNLTGIYASNPQIHAEYAISEKFGLEGSVGTKFGRDEITSSGGGTSTVTEWRRGGFLAGAQAKYYFGPDEPTTNFYGAVYARYRNTTWKDQEVNGEAVANAIDYNNNRLALGLAAGAKYLIAEKFVVEAAGGLGFAAVNDNEFVDAFEGDLDFFEKLSTLDLYARVSVGYRLF